AAAEAIARTSEGELDEAEEAQRARGVRQVGVRRPASMARKVEGDWAPWALKAVVEEEPEPGLEAEGDTEIEAESEASQAEALGGSDHGEESGREQGSEGPSSDERRHRSSNQNGESEAA